MDEEHRGFDPAPGEAHVDKDLPAASSEMPESEAVEPTPAGVTAAEGMDITPGEVPAGEVYETAAGETPVGEDIEPTREVGPVEAGGLPPELGPMVAAPTEPGPTQDERTIAALAHASMLLNLVTGFGGLIAAALIWLVYRDRSKYVEDQALQATVFQGLWLVSWAAIGGMWVVVALLTAVVIGLCLIPFALLLTFVPLIAFFYPLYAAVEAYQGRDFKYWWIGDLVRGHR